MVEAYKYKLIYEFLIALFIAVAVYYCSFSYCYFVVFLYFIIFYCRVRWVNYY